MKKNYLLSSLISLPVSVAALVLACRYSIDVSYIITALAALVTVLIGWNIYALIDLRQTKKEIDNKNVIVLEDLNRALYGVFSSLATLYMREVKIDKMRVEELNEQFILYSVLAISQASILRDYKICAAQVKMTMDYLSDPGVTVSEEGKRSAIKALSFIKNGDKIDGYEKFLDRIGSLVVK